MTYWTENERERFPFFVLDGVKSPGIVTAIEVNGVPLKYDEQNGYELSGVFTRFVGLGLSSIKFTVRLVDEEDRAAMDNPKWQRASAPPAEGQTVRIQTLGHPIIERMKATTGRWKIQEVPTEKPATGEGGGVVVVYDYKNDRKAKQQGGKPLPPKNATTGKVPNQRQQVIAAIGAQITAELAKGKS